MPSEKKKSDAKQLEKQTQMLEEITKYIQSIFEAGDQECQIKN